MKKMLSFVADGITSFSIKPLQMISLLGFLMLLVSIGMIITTVYDFYTGRTVPGWASSYCSTWFIGSVQLLSLGIIGEYIGKIYLETKRRPRYHIEAFLWNDGDKRRITMQTDVVFHADDFGANREISEYILDCFREGALNSLSVLSNSNCLEECINCWHRIGRISGSASI